MVHISDKYSLVYIKGINKILTSFNFYVCTVYGGVHDVQKMALNPL